MNIRLSISLTITDLVLFAFFINFSNKDYRKEWWLEQQIFSGPENTPKKVNFISILALILSLIIYLIIFIMQNNIKEIKESSQNNIS